MRYAESPHEPRIADVTFGPLEKYVAANDNVPGAKSIALRHLGDMPGENQPCAGWPDVPVAEQPAPVTREEVRADGVYRFTTYPSTDSGQFRGDNPHMEMTPEERLPSGLALLAARHGYVYLGSPYSKYEAGHDAAARVVADAAAALMRRGLVIYSPIAHGHAVAAHGLPLTWNFWKRQCQPLIDGAAGLIVLTMAGWQESVGLQYEIEEFVRAGKPILHVSPRWLAENKVGRVAGC